MKKIITSLFLLCLSLIGIKGQAQSFADDLSFSLDWQMNAPIGKNDYANKFSVWGMNLDAGYEITSQWTAGVFASFHTNHRYVGRETFPLSPTASLTTDQQQSSFQVPFGAFGRYYVYDNGYIRPYVCDVRTEYDLSECYEHLRTPVGFLRFAGDWYEYQSQALLSLRLPCGPLLQLCHE